MLALGSSAQLILLLLSGCVVAWLVLPAGWRGGKDSAVAGRFRRFAKRGGGANTEQGVRGRVSSIFSAGHDGSYGRMRAAIKTGFANIGGIKVLRRLVLGGVATAVLVPLAALLWLGWGAPAALTAAVGSGVGVMVLAYWQLKRRWQITFLDNLADAIDLVVRAVRSGIPVSEAIRVAGKEINEPVRTEFQQIADSIDLGIELKDALRTAAERIRLPDFDFFVVTLVIQRETGGQLAETLEGLSVVLRRRKELRMKIRAMTAEGRMSATIVAAMPIAAGLGMYLMDPDHIGRLFEPGTGQTMFYGALGLMGLGIAVTFQMTKVKP